MEVIFRSPRSILGANGPHEVRYVPPRPLRSLRPCWTAFLSILRECSALAPNVQIIEVLLCRIGFSRILLGSCSLHNHHTLKPRRVVDQLVDSVPGYLVDNPAHRTSLAGTNFHDQCAAGREVSNRFV